MQPDARRIKAGLQDGVLLFTGFRDHFPMGITDETASVENLSAFVAVAIDRYNRSDVGHRVPEHHPLPHAPRVEFGLGRLAADGRRIKKQIRPAQNKCPRAFGKPLIPADPDSQISVAGFPYTKTGVPGPEIKLLLVTGAVRNMGFSVHSKDGAVGVHHSQ